jgi:hypothetical protein
MRILDVSMDVLEISFRKPLRTALCEFQKLENILLKLNTGPIIGFGEASPSLAVTGGHIRYRYGPSKGAGFEHTGGG